MEIHREIMEFREEDLLPDLPDLPVNPSTSAISDYFSDKVIGQMPINRALAR
jgi:hypothetical protein